MLFRPTQDAAPGAAVVGAPPWLALAPAALVEAAFSFFHLPCTVRTFVSIFSGHPIASGQGVRVGEVREEKTS